jgi:predicted transcriptional regulator of viral defense system
MTSLSLQRLVDLVRTAGVLRARDLEVHGIGREQLRRLRERGVVEQIGRGLYRLPGADISEHQSLVEAAKRVPQGIVCLQSALRFHGLTTQNPFEVWLALDRKARLPKVDAPPLRFVRFSGLALTQGIEQHRLQGIQVRIYSAAKTVADCFKYRNKIGLDVAVEALGDYVRHGTGSLDDLWRFAKICRVSNVIRPYLESLG